MRDNTVVQTPARQMYDRRPKDSKGGKATMEVNGVEWSVDSARKERPCASCGMLTKGRIGRKPMCLGDGMKELMKPIGDFRDRLEALLGTNGALFK